MKSLIVSLKKLFGFNSSSENQQVTDNCVDVYYKTYVDRELHLSKFNVIALNQDGDTVFEMYSGFTPSSKRKFKVDTNLLYVVLERCIELNIKRVVIHSENQDLMDDIISKDNSKFVKRIFPLIEKFEDISFNKIVNRNNLAKERLLEPD